MLVVHVDLWICGGKTYGESKQQTKIIRHQTKFRFSVDKV